MDEKTHWRDFSYSEKEEILNKILFRIKNEILDGSIDNVIYREEICNDGVIRDGNGNILQYYPNGKRFSIEYRTSEMKLI